MSDCANLHARGISKLLFTLRVRVIRPPANSDRQESVRVVVRRIANQDRGSVCWRGFNWLPHHPPPTRSARVIATRPMKTPHLFAPCGICGLKSALGPIPFRGNVRAHTSAESHQLALHLQTSFGGSRKSPTRHLHGNGDGFLRFGCMLLARLK